VEEVAAEVPAEPVPAHLLKPDESAEPGGDEASGNAETSPAPEPEVVAPTQEPAVSDTPAARDDANETQKEPEFVNMPTIPFAPAPGGACQVCLSSSKIGKSPSIRAYA
jgi:hypothetical protein